MKAKLWRTAIIAPALLLAIVVEATGGQPRLPGAGEEPFEPGGALVMPSKRTSATIAVPSLPAPFKWPDRPDMRELEQIPQAEQEKLAIEFMRAYAPLHLQHLERAKAREPAEYYQSLRETLRERLEMQRMRLFDPKAFKQREKRLQVDAQCQQLAQIYREATADKRPAIEKQLRRLAGQAFDMRQAEMQQHVKNIEREYNRLKSVVEKRRKYKGMVIEFHLLRLLGEEDVLEMW